MATAFTTLQANASFALAGPVGDKMNFTSVANCTRQLAKALALLATLCGIGACETLTAADFEQMDDRRLLIRCMTDDSAPLGLLLKERGLSSSEVVPRNQLSDVRPGMKEADAVCALNPLSVILHGGGVQETQILNGTMRLWVEMEPDHIVITALNGTVISITR